jgi:hypothetical protein
MADKVGLSEGEVDGVAGRVAVTKGEYSRERTINLTQ